MLCFKYSNVSHPFFALIQQNWTSHPTCLLFDNILIVDLQDFVEQALKMLKISNNLQFEVKEKYKTIFTDLI